MENKDIITVIVGLLGAAGWLGAVAAYRKSKPEAGKIFVDAAQGVVLMQTGVIGRLEKEIDELRQENARVTKENEELKQKLESLEEKVRKLTDRTTIIEEKEGFN